jgi:hypothetical protein
MQIAEIEAMSFTNIFIFYLLQIWQLSLCMHFRVKMMDLIFKNKGIMHSYKVIMLEHWISILW